MRYFLIAFLLLTNLSLAGPRSQVTVTVTATSAKFLDTESGRDYLLIVNKGSNTIYVKFGSHVGSGEGIPIPAGGNYEPYDAPDDAVYMKSASGSQSVEIVRG